MTKPLSVLTISDVFKAINRLNRLRRKRMPNSRRVQKAAMEAINEMMMETDETFRDQLDNSDNDSEKVLILFSGGADSMYMFHLAKQMGYTPMCVLFDYGQLHIEELEVAIGYLNSVDADYNVVKIGGLNLNSGLTGDGVKNSTGVVHEMHVPMRNTMFLSLACSIAESEDIKKVWIGCDMDDRYHLFPDCYQEYIVGFNEMLKFAGPKEIIVEAPVLGMSKENVLRYLTSMGLTPDSYFSGYGDL